MNQNFIPRGTYVPYIQLQNKRKNNEASDVLKNILLNWQHDKKWLYNNI